MRLTLTMTDRVPGKALTVRAEAQIDMETLFATKRDPGLFLFDAANKLRAAIQSEIKKHQEHKPQAAAPPDMAAELARRRERTARLKAMLSGAQQQPATGHD